jgi:hypothetical protein
MHRALNLRTEGRVPVQRSPPPALGPRLLVRWGAAPPNLGKRLRTFTPGDVSVLPEGNTLEVGRATSLLVPVDFRLGTVFLLFLSSAFVVLLYPDAACLLTLSLVLRV